ncbi:hypothetical protein R8Z50_18680 [Longispora sp. K20-0274]|uniref:hypothetical protein n=1 Tax=Longispora sp. K20-0274 TaxID=3088255 RepID=UPI00399C1B53
MTADDVPGFFGVREHHPAGQIVLTDPVMPGIRSRLLVGAGLGTTRGYSGEGVPSTLSMNPFCGTCSDAEDDDWWW